MSALALVTALSLLALAPAAQGTQFRRGPQRLRSVQLDLDTGLLTRGPTVNNRTASTVADFSNIDLGGFVGVDCPRRSPSAP